MNILKTKKTYNFKTIQKQIEKLSMRLFLLLSEAQSSGFIPFCNRAEMSARWRTGLIINILRALYFHKCCANFIFVLMTNPTAHMFGSLLSCH